MPEDKKNVPFYTKHGFSVMENGAAMQICNTTDVCTHLSFEEPTAISGMSKAEIDLELQKGMDSLKSGKVYTADEVEAEFAREFGKR